MHHKYFTYTFTVLFLFITGLSLAQISGSKNISALQLEDIKRQWGTSDNPAGLLLDNPSISSRLQGGFTKDKGDFKRPQSSDSENTVFLNTQGNAFFKNYYLEGDFSYGRNARKGVEYNASLIDPLRNMPYIIADTNSSDWLNQHYNLGFKFSTAPINKKWMFGLAAAYKAASGAKQRDIRSENFFYSLEIQPGVVYSLNTTHHIGTNFYYNNFKEEARNSLLNTNEHQGYYLLHGLGNGTNHVGTGRTMNYQGDAFGFNSQYQYTGPIRLMLSAGYTIQAEDANIGFTNSRPVGTILNKKWKYSIQGGYTGEEYTQIMKGQYLDSRSKGIEYLTEFESGLDSEGYYVRHRNIRSTYDQKQADFSYQIIKNRAESYNWKARAQLSYSNLENMYLIPESSMSLQNIYFALSLDKIFQLSARMKNELNIGIITGLKANQKASYKYTGANTQTLLVKDLEKRNMDYLSADITSFEVPIMYSQKINSLSDNHIFIRLSAQLTKSNHDLLKDRKSFYSSIGLTF